MGKAVSRVEVTRTYYQMADRAALAPPGPTPPGVRVDEVLECPPSFYRYLYREVGRNYHWVDRLGWTDDEIRRHLARDAISIWLMTCSGAPAGYFELEAHEDSSIEIAYFGLLPEFIGRGLGKYLLEVAVQTAWATGPVRVWLHTCTLDDPSAVPNYVKRGFSPYKTETYWTEISAEERQWLKSQLPGEN